SDEQWSVVELVRTRPLVLLTGLPGAGKTHTQRVLVELARRARGRVLLFAPTGKAARRMRDLTGHEAMTIHRALAYSPSEGGFQRNADSPLSKDYDLVVVDEASMLSLELADALFEAVGDCHVLLVGDTDQLPPIGPGSVLADLVACAIVPRVHLTAIYRQAARSLIIQSARRINAGRLPFLSLEEEGEARLSLDEGEREIVAPVSALETYELAWALTVHRSQGSQFPAVVVPWSTAYSVMLSRALLYTAVTRAQQLCVLVGERQALAIALGRSAQRHRNSALAERIVDGAAN